MYANDTNPMIGAFNSITECLKEVKARCLVDHMPTEENSCIAELKERVEKLLVAVVKNEKLKSGTGS